MISTCYQEKGRVGAEVVACLISHHLRRRPSGKVVLAIVKEAVEITKEFLTEALPVSLIEVRPSPLHFSHLKFSLLFT